MTMAFFLSILMRTKNCTSAVEHIPLSVPPHTLLLSLGGPSITHVISRRPKRRR